MKKYGFLLAILFLIGCNSSAPETVDNKGKIEHTKNTAQTGSESKAISNSAKRTISTAEEKSSSAKGPLLSDDLNKKKPAAINSKEKPSKADIPTEVPKAPIKKEVEKLISAATPSKEKVVPPPPQPTPKVIEAPKVIAKKIEKVQPPKPEPKKVEKIEAPKKTTTVAHTIFDGLLRKHVSSSGKVNYQSFKSSESTLDKYIGTLEGIKVSDLSGRNEKMAFWINAYNAYTVKLILKNYPLKSITDLHGGKPWDVKWIKLDGRTLSLNNIENDILRPTYKDPRIHFAVNCAAKSCPSLLNKAWTPSNLESSFSTQTKKFVNNTNFNKINKKKVEISKIFEWYGEDFGNLVNFLNKYTSTKINSDAKVEFVEYDWSLNN